MAVVLVEGFDHIGTLYAQKGWTLTAGAAAQQSGRLTGSSVGLGPTVSQLVKALPGAYATLLVGAAVNFPSTASNNTFIILTSAGGTPIVQLRLNGATNKLEALSAGGSVIATGTTIVNAGWAYIELKAFVNGATSTVEVHVNGNVDIASTVVNLGSASVAQFAIQTGAAATTLFDDIYCADTSGAAPNNTFLGDVTVETEYPDSDGAHIDFTPDSGTAHYARLNETIPDGDASYVASNTVGAHDSYGFGSSSAVAGDVHAVQVTAYARKNEAGGRKLALVARPGTTDHDSAGIPLGNSYAFVSEILETNPDTAAAWTLAEINAAEFGVKVDT
jgi:hypothetical protein